MKFPKLNKDFAYILGSLRDGSLIFNEDKKYWIRIYDRKDSTWLEELSVILYRTFDVRFHMRYQKKINMKYLDVSCKDLYNFLQDVIGHNLHGDIPEAIRNSEMGLQKAYIAGFFDAEGYVPYPTVKNKRFRISFNQKNRQALVFIRDVLQTLGIKCSKISQHVLPIYGKHNLMKFYDSFELRNPEKTRRLKSLLCGYNA